MSAGRPTVADALRRGLAALGVEATYGEPLPGLGVAPAPDPAVAALLAEAHLLVHRTRCAVHHGGTLTVVGRRAVVGRPPPGADAGPSGPAEAPAWPPGTADTLVVEDAAGLAACWAEAATRLSGPAGAVALGLALDPAGPAPEAAVAALAALPAAADRWVPADDEAVARIDGAAAPVVLVGPGVADPALVPGLHALAAAGGLGVLNTWGAKGVFDWRSRHHVATVGLQAQDLVLGGLAGADLVVAAGLDGREVPAAGWDAGRVLTLAPGALGPVAERLRRRREPADLPPLRPALARITQDGWAQAGTPLAPSRATQAYARAVGPAGLVAAAPGVAGFWVARTFATTALGAAVVPARPGADGLAAACVAVARRRWPDRPALAVVDAGADGGTGGADGATAAVVEAAARWGVTVPVEAWGEGGEALDADAHAARLDGLVGGPARPAATLATDGAQMTKMVEVAGAVVAWRREEGDR